MEDLKEDKNLLQGIDTTSKTKATQYIQYDMAVNKNDKGLIVAPYYINKVKAIYFKPEAQLRRQQFLTYDTARVEFEMTPDAKYWMASPLQSVFAGDMYTVKNTGRQNTYAFADITYSTGDNIPPSPSLLPESLGQGDHDVRAEERSRSNSFFSGEWFGYNSLRGSPIQLEP